MNEYTAEGRHGMGMDPADQIDSRAYQPPLIGIQGKVVNHVTTLSCVQPGRMSGT